LESKFENGWARGGITALALGGAHVPRVK